MSLCKCLPNIVCPLLVLGCAYEESLIRPSDYKWGEEEFEGAASYVEYNFNSQDILRKAWNGYRYMKRNGLIEFWRETICKESQTGKNSNPIRNQNQSWNKEGRSLLDCFRQLKCSFFHLFQSGRLLFLGIFSKEFGSSLISNLIRLDCSPI